jgi:hypothetical protein
MDPPDLLLANLSPELVLVDPHLAAGAREQLADTGELASVEHDRCVPTEQDRAAALRRMSRIGELAEFPAERRPRLGLPKFAAAITTWITALVLAADVRLYDWSTWPL